MWSLSPFCCFVCLCFYMSHSLGLGNLKQEYFTLKIKYRTFGAIILCLLVTLKAPAVNSVTGSVLLWGNTPLKHIVNTHVLNALLWLFSVRNRLREIVGASTNWRYWNITRIHRHLVFTPVIERFWTTSVVINTFVPLWMCPPQRPSAGHGGARLTVVHVGQIAKRSSPQENEGQLPGGPPAAGLWAAAPRKIPDFPQHRQVSVGVRGQMSYSRVLHSLQRLLGSFF